MTENPWRGCTCNEGGSAGCPVHDAAASDADGNKVFEYQCLVIGGDGNGAVEVLAATDTSHAFTEAWYCFDGKCVAVRRGEYLYQND